MADEFDPDQYIADFNPDQYLADRQPDTGPPAPEQSAAPTAFDPDKYLASFDPDKYLADKQQPEAEGHVAADVREAAHGVLPAVGMGIVSGALSGAATGLKIPLPPIARLATGIGGAIVGGYLGSKVDDATLGAALGDTGQRQANMQARPIETGLAGMASMAGNPLMAGKTLAEQAVERGIGGSVMGAFDVGQQAYNTGKVDIPQAASSVAFGAAFPNGNRFTRAVHGAGESIGEKAAGYVPGRPDVAAKAASPEAQQAADDTADASQSPSVAGNNALAQQPAADPKTVNPDAQVSGTKVKADGGEVYSKAAVDRQPTQASYGDIDPTIADTLRSSITENAEPPAPPPPPEPVKPPARAPAPPQRGQVIDAGFPEPPPGRVNAEDQYGRYTQPAEPEYTPQQQAERLAAIEARKTPAPVEAPAAAPVAPVEPKPETPPLPKEHAKVAESVEETPNYDPFEMAKRGELSATKANEIHNELRGKSTAVENEILGTDADKWRKAHRLSDTYWNRGYEDIKAKEQDKIISDIESRLSEQEQDRLYGQGEADFTDPEGWKDLVHRLDGVEGDRDEALAVLANELRDIPDGSKKFSQVDREKLAVIQHAINKESERGGDPQTFLKDALKRSHDRYGGGHDATEIVADDAARLRRLFSMPEEPVKQLPTPTRQPLPTEHAKVADALRVRGMDDLADKFEAMSPADRLKNLPAIREALKPIRARVTEKANLKNKLGAEANTPAKRDIQNRAIDAVQKAYDEHPPPEDETADQLVTRLQAAVDTAHTAHGSNPLAKTSGYRPLSLDEHPTFNWFNKVQNAAGKAREYWTPKKIAEFKTEEDLAREGGTKSTDAMDAGIAKSRRSGDEAVEKAANKIAVSPENELAAALDAKKAGMTPEEAEEALSKGAFEGHETEEEETPATPRKTAITNRASLLAAERPNGYDPALDKFEEVKAAASKQAEERAAAEAAKKVPPVEERTKPLTAKQLKAAGVRGMEISPEVQERYRKLDEESRAKAAAREASHPAEVLRKQTRKILKGIDERPVVDDAAIPDEKSSGFWDNERGVLDTKKIHQDWRAMGTAVRGALTKYMGIPFSDIQKRIDAGLAFGVSSKEQMSKGMRDVLDGRWRVWGKEATPADVVKYLTTIEKPGSKTRDEMVQALKDAGISDKNAEWMADEAPFHRQIMKSIFEGDRALLKGTKGAYEAVENYVTYIFADAKGAMNFIDGRIKNLGPTWYQKERTFDTIQAALDAGYKLKFKNPIDMIGARWKASINSAALLNTARWLHREGLAYPLATAPEEAKGWTKIGQLPDRQQWVIHPEGEYLWKNAMEAKGLAEREDAIGSIYRAWMQAKSVWTPIKLALSAFHAVHIASIHFTRPITRFVKQSFNDPANTAKFGGQALKATLADPLLAMPLDKIPMFGKILDAGMQKGFGTSFSTFDGRTIREQFGKDPSEIQNPDDRMWVGLSKEAGFSPFQSHEETIGAKRAFAQALDQRAPFGMLWHGFRRGIEKIQNPLFQDFIPSLKYMAFKQSVSDLIARDPTLASDAPRRIEALREIGKNLDDTYGEMFYKGLFWNKTLKDIGIGTQLSMSWNLGQYRQLTGFARDAAKNVAGAAMQLKDTGNIKGATERYRTPSQLNKYRADDKLPFVASYVGTSMAISGLLSWALSGEFPTGLDYVFPRAGRHNPDGTPQRLSPPFNTREPFQLKGHAEEANSWVGGLQTYLWNKMVLQPIVEVAKNKDFYGNKLWDDQAPWYKRVLQGADSVIGSNFSPITLSGANRAKQEGAGAGGQALAYAGFAPAAKYLNFTPMENRIAGVYHGSFPDARPYEYGAKTGLGRGLVQGGIRALAGDPLQSEARQEGRAALGRAIATGDKEAEIKARQQLATQGNMGKVAGKIDPANEHAYQFSKLGKGDQISIGRDMDKADFQRFVVKNPNYGVSKPVRAQLMKERGLL